MMEDDIAHNLKNPYKGNIINKPNGENVYPGVNKDYTGMKVTASRFLEVLKGESSAGHKVLKSGPNDNVFIYYTDHGAVGLVAMPNGGYLYANKLNEALKYLHDNKRYRQLVFYLEACESGSMFENILPANIQIYATTASNAEESSYACYFDEKRNAYLGDLYSVNFLEDTEVADLTRETLEQQFEVVRNKTNLSHVQQYGERDWIQSTLDKFFVYNNATHFVHPTGPKVNPATDSVSSRDVKINILKKRLHSATGDKRKIIEKELLLEISIRREVDTTFSALNAKIGVDRLTTRKLIMDSNFNWNCYSNAVDVVETACGKFTDYSLKYAKNIAIMCASDITVYEIENAAKIVCHNF